MKKVFIIVVLILSGLQLLAADKSLYLMGRVKESVGKTDLTSAHVLRFDSLGNVSDSIACNQGRAWRDGEMVPVSYFGFDVPRVDSTYTFEVVCEGYMPQLIDYTVANVGNREKRRDIPTIYLDKVHTLREVTVTSSKIKFYNKGDTIVYDADAFQLAEGSMLDALIAQMPGVELNDDGQIKVNGQFVESLLLNGKEFMDGNNNLMLENIAAYTVKNVQVYEGQTTQDKRMGNIEAPKVLTMDVRLKKEYNIGWLINAQGGYGTDDRYIGKVFASWFNPTTRVSLLGNVNNLNDNRKPGRNDTWTPEKMPSGTREYRMGGIDYNYENPEETREASGSLTYEQTIDVRRRTTAQTNFLPGGDTYDNSFSDSRNDERRLRTNHSLWLHNAKHAVGLRLGGLYSRLKNTGSSLSGTFDSEQDGITPEILDALYSDGSEERLASVLNRSRTRSDGWTRGLSGNVNAYYSYKLPRSEDNLAVSVGASYQSVKDYAWRDYDINYGADPTPAYRLRQYIDNTPNHNLTLNTDVRYKGVFAECYFALSYRYMFNDNVKDSYMYSLDRLEDMGIYGVLPSDYLLAFDPANSFTSRTLTNTHTLAPSFILFKNYTDSRLDVRLNPEIGFDHRNLYYMRNNRDYRLSKANTTVNIHSIWDGMIEYHFGKLSDGRRFRHDIRYSYRITPTLPDMTDMLEIVDDSNPLNIYVGNPDLKVQYRHNHLVRWSFSPAARRLNNVLYLGYIHTTNALTRGYTYDTTTGVRINRMYNVCGNDRTAVTNEFEMQFGSHQQFTIDSSTDFAYAHATDMIGVNGEAPELSKVHNATFTQKINFGWQIGGQSLQLRADYTNRHTASTQTGFADIDANHVNVGVNGIFKLPAGFGISTDFTLYTRRGYGVAELDTTDPVWNARVSYCPPRNTRWVFMLDGFDILHRLSNVSYAVTASGRTVSYTNALPRYLLLSVQYRLNIQPKKR